MIEMEQKRKDEDEGLLKKGTSRRARMTNRRGMPRILLIAVAVAVVGAYLLFRDRGADLPAGIGERRSEVTVGADSVELSTPAPHSGDVDIAAATQGLTPEQPAGGKTETAPPPQEKPAEPAPKPTPAKTTTTPAAPPEEKIEPAASGGWVVQAGSFGEATNADRLAEKLHGYGWNAVVKAGNTSSGTMIHRVQIGYFSARSVAEKFIRQNRKNLPDAIVVHR